MLTYLDAISHQKILRLQRQQDQQASLLGKMLLLKGLLQFGYQKEYLKEIAYTEFGRPFFNLPLDFNISHSGNLIVCALSDKGKIGIDAEEIRPLHIEDFKDTFSIDEYNSILMSKNPYGRFFNTWTGKEAVAKANGKGLYIPLKEIIIENNMALLYSDKWHVKDILLSEKYSCAIAASVPGKEVLVKYIDVQSLIIEC